MSDFFVRLIKKRSLCLFGFLFLCGLIISTGTLAAEKDQGEAARIAPPLKTLMRGFKPADKTEAQVLLRKTDVYIDAQLMSHATSYVAVYINSDEAVRDYSQISVTFNSFYEDIQLEFAHVRTPDGKLDSIKADATQIQSPTDENFYHDRKELLFSLPNVRKGSVIEFQYRYTDTKKMVPNQWFDSFSFHWWEDLAAGQGTRADAILTSELSITAPTSIHLFSSDVTPYQITQKRSAQGQQQTVTWTGKNIAKIELQSDMPREHNYAPYLRVATTDKWNDVARWADGLVEPHLLSDAALAQIVTDIKQTALTPDAKVKAVYQTIQDHIRYVFAHVGRGGYEPHDTTDILKNGYGDCKDQTVLAVKLLRDLGIKADPALIITRGRGIPDMTIPGISFDHMIVHIPAQNGLQEIWMDTTGETSLYPGFSVGIEGQPALIVNEQSKQISVLPSQGPDKHFAHLELVFDKFDGQNAQASFKLTFGGLYEQRLRSMWQYSRERDKYFRELIGQIYNAAEVIELNTSNADNLWQPFVINGRFAFTKVWGGDKEPINYAFSITQLTNLFADLRNLHKPDDRKQPYVNDPGYSLQSRIVFNSPSTRHQLRIKTRGVNIDNPYYKLVQTGTQEPQRYIVEQNLTLKTSRIELANYADFYQKTEELLDSTDWTLAYEYDATAADMAALQSNGKNDIASLIALSKLHIKNGDYQQALETAQSAVTIAPTNAEAHYQLGLALGYTHQFKESDAAFKKAEALGYKL
ncbi:DUF3857 domain-containing protein [Cellvibrio mixtus]|uniref:DUF3857 domain-containing protein n=1 Tax=Cellvibrio mixtus TaxID=39650 RepID=UPI00058717B9|nr:DUF3857 domain-containing protein [Cellvibrio mixtus]